MSANKIKIAAMSLFANYGYEGTSLAHIASKVGIKKQSIYSHFDGKDDLFIQVMNDALQQELSHLHDVVMKEDTQSFNETLCLLIQDIIDRFSNDKNMKFWLRMSFYPPMHLLEEVNKAVYFYEDEQLSLLEPIFHKAINENKLKKREPEQLVIAFIALMNAIMMELVYGGEKRAQQVATPSMEIFLDGISIASKGEE